MATRLVIVDDSAPVRSGLTALLSADGFDVVAACANAADGFAAVEELRPDLVLLDVTLPDRSGFEVARWLRGLRPSPRVVLTSSRAYDDIARHLDECGAVGFVAKELVDGASVARSSGISP